MKQLTFFLQVVPLLDLAEPPAGDGQFLVQLPDLLQRVSREGRIKGQEGDSAVLQETVQD